MANVKISDLTGAASASGTQEFEVNDSGTSKKVTGSQLATFIEGEVSSSPTLTGQVSLDNGTNTAPSLTNTGDTNTGLYFPSDDTVGLAAGGGLKLSANASGVDITGSLSVDGGTIKLDGNYPVGSFNVALGDQALDSVTSGTNNTALGGEALTSLTTGVRNTAVGHRSLYVNQGGERNTAVGQAAMFDNTSGNYNTAVGQSALENNTTANNNTAVGYQAGFSNTTGISNTAAGYQALKENVTGSYNVAMGQDALRDNTASNNVAIGVNALQLNTTGTNNSGFTGAKMLMRVSLPVFVLPEVAAKPLLHWQAAQTSKGALKLSVSNSGNAHIQIKNFKLSLPGSSQPLATNNTVDYILPGQRYEWVLQANENYPISTPDSTLQLFAQTDAGDIEASVIIEP